VKYHPEKILPENLFCKIFLFLGEPKYITMAKKKSSGKKASKAASKKKKAKKSKKSRPSKTKSRKPAKKKKSKSKKGKAKTKAQLKAAVTKPKVVPLVNEKQDTDEVIKQEEWKDSFIQDDEVDKEDMDAFPAEDEPMKLDDLEGMDNIQDDDEDELTEDENNY
jgi:LAS superfamily LD-carboxypeptidase LdcB